MNNYNYILLFLSITLLLFTSGCKNRQVTQLLDPPTETILSETLSPETSVENPASSQAITQENTTSNEQENEDEEQKEEIAPTPDKADITGHTTTLIIAESANIDDIDERALLLNELDALLDSVFDSLENLEENPITEDMTDFGGE
jgi:hypothetical protein